jgi:hypothetical protein
LIKAGRREAPGPAVSTRPRPGVVSQPTQVAHPSVGVLADYSRYALTMRNDWTLGLLMVPLAAGGIDGPVRSSPATVASASVNTRAPAGATGQEWVEMRNVDLHLTNQVVIRVRSLHGEVLRTDRERPPALDDATSFRIRVTAGTVALTGADLGALLNTVVFAYPNAPLRDLRLRTDGDEIIQTGIMHKGVDLRFRLRGTLDLTPDGRVRIHPSAVHILGFNGQKVLHLFGLRLESLLDLRGARGASVKGDDLFLDPTAILPAPAIDGHLAAVRIEGTEVVQEFVRLGDDALFRRAVHADTVDHNFIYFHGGQLRFGKLLMNDTDLRIVGTDQTGAFDMSLPHYSQQLVAGYSRTLANQGLLVDMPNFAALNRMAPNHAASAAGDIAASRTPSGTRGQGQPIAR